MTSLLLVAGTLAGNAAGKRTLGRISSARFSRIVAAVLLSIVGRALGGA